MIVDRACQWWLIHRYWPHREAVLNADPRWVELRALQAAALGRDQPLEEWVRMILEQGAIQRRLFPVEPWAELLGLHRKELCALYEARARRRADIWGILRIRIGEGLWAAGTVAASRVAATIALAGRVVQDRGYDGLEWSEWQEILTDNDDPPEVCEQFALGLADHGCVEDCSLPPRGRVRCLRPRGEALARLIANGPVD